MFLHSDANRASDLLSGAREVGGSLVGFRAMSRLLSRRRSTGELRLEDRRNLGPPRRLVTNDQRDTAKHEQEHGRIIH